MADNKLRHALRLCMEQMCARCREAADALTLSVPCLEGCEALRIAKAALTTDDKDETLGGNTMDKMRKALDRTTGVLAEILDAFDKGTGGVPRFEVREAIAEAKSILAVLPLKGKWVNGTRYEYEYAYCSVCGRMQWAEWNSHGQAEEYIETFADNYKFCPSCGAKMEGGVYVK